MNLLTGVMLLYWCNVYNGRTVAVSLRKISSGMSYSNSKSTLDKNSADNVARGPISLPNPKLYSLPYFILSSSERGRGLAALGIGNAVLPYPGRRHISDEPSLIENHKRYSSFLPSFVIPSETSRNRGLAALGIGSGMVRSGRNKIINTDKKRSWTLPDDPQLLEEMENILSSIKDKVKVAEIKKSLKNIIGGLDDKELNGAN